MDSETHDDLVSSIAPYVMGCLDRRSFFTKLDDLLCPEGNSNPAPRCDGTFKHSESILIDSNFDRAEIEEIFAVLQSKGGCCDCEVLYNVAETSRLKANHWRARLADHLGKTPPSK